MLRKFTDDHGHERYILTSTSKVNYNVNKNQNVRQTKGNLQFFQNFSNDFYIICFSDPYLRNFNFEYR